MRVRRAGAVLLSAGLVCLGGAAVPLVTAHADADLGSGLGSFALSANAPVLQARFDNPANQCTATAAGPGGCEGVVNESVSQLSNGPVGYALSSVAWPGTLGGNLGNLLIVAGGAPQQVTMLNSPVRAESHTGDKPVVTDYPPAPAPAAAHMIADAEATKVTAEASLAGATQPALGSLGTSASNTVTELTGVSAARAVAHSEVHDLTIAGVLHLGAVVSDATATTDGAHATANGHTLVTGASVNGTPVTIDENGVHAAGQGAPLPTQATDAVNTALKGAGITVSLSTPHGTPVGAGVTYDAGALHLVWKIQDGMVASVELGGAQVSVASSTAFVFTMPAAPPFTASAPGSQPATGTVNTGVSPAAPGGVFVPQTTGAAPAPTVSGSVPFAPVVAAEHSPWPRGLSPWLGGLVVVGAFLTMAGLRRLPDRVLVASTASCPNGAR